MTTTQGSIPVTPVLVSTTASLQEIRNAITERRYDRDPFGSGWGSVRDSDDLVNQPGQLRPDAGAPELVSPEGEYPTQLRVRYYWNDAEPVRNGTNESTQLTRLRAVDIVLSERSVDGRLLALVSERNETRVQRAVEGLRDAVESVDESASIVWADDELAIGDSDFFRWLLYRAEKDPDLTEGYTLTSVRAIRSADSRTRTANLGRGVDFDRTELLALVSSKFNQFGPAKLYVWSNGLSLGASLELAGDGSFTIYRGGTDYHVRPGEEPLPEPDFSLKLLQDVAYVLIPDLKRLYLADSQWTDATRDDFRRECITKLIASLEAELDSLNT